MVADRRALLSPAMPGTHMTPTEIQLMDDMQKKRTELRIVSCAVHKMRHTDKQSYRAHTGLIQGSYRAHTGHIQGMAFLVFLGMCAF